RAPYGPTVRDVELEHLRPQARLAKSAVEGFAPLEVAHRREHPPTPACRRGDGLEPEAARASGHHENLVAHRRLLECEELFIFERPNYEAHFRFCQVRDGSKGHGAATRSRPGAGSPYRRPHPRRGEQALR